FRHRRVLQRLRLRGQPHRGPQAEGEGHSGGDPPRRLAGLAGSRLPRAQGEAAVKALSHPVLQRLLGLALGAAFLYASLDKIAHPVDFARIVYPSQVIGPSQQIPPLVPNLFAVVLPWVEAVLGLLLLVGFWRREAALGTAVLLVVFLLAVGSAVYRGIDV